MSQTPWSLVTALRVSPETLSTAVICTPGTIEPPGSVIVPVNCPLTDCAWTCCEKNPTKTRKAMPAPIVIQLLSLLVVVVAWFDLCDRTAALICVVFWAFSMMPHSSSIQLECELWLSVTGLQQLAQNHCYCSWRTIRPGAQPKRNWTFANGYYAAPMGIVNNIIHKKTHKHLIFRDAKRRGQKQTTPAMGSITNGPLPARLRAPRDGRIDRCSTVRTRIAQAAREALQWLF